MQDQTSPESGQPNVAPPSTAEQNYGYTYKARPTRQKLNHLFRAFGKWFHWLGDEEVPRLDGRITTEGVNRAEADSILQNNIDSEAGTRETIDGILQGAINTEISERGIAVGEEEAARIAADGILQGNITTEELARQLGDANIYNELETRLDLIESDKMDNAPVSVLQAFGFASNMNVLAYYQLHSHRCASKIMVEVVLFIPETYDTSDDQYLGFVSASIPEAIRPDADQWVTVLTFDNSVFYPTPSVMKVAATGDWDIKKYDGSGFTTSNSKGFASQIIRYRKNII